LSDLTTARGALDSGQRLSVYDEKGVLTRVAGVGRDITPEKEIGRKLLVTQQRFLLLLERARYAMFMIGLDNRITYWSAGAERIFGWSAEEAVGQPGTLIFTPRIGRVVRK
jgi:PAS domain-containing protein